MTDVAEQLHHFGFLGVLELLRLLNRQRGECGNDREESEVVFRERPVGLFTTIETPLGSPRQRRIGIVILSRVTNPVV